MPNPKRRNTKKAAAKKSAAPTTGLASERVDELSEAFSHYANLRETVAENLKAATGLGARNFWRDLLRLLDLAADAAERVDGFSLNPEADEATGELAAFLR